MITSSWTGLYKSAAIIAWITLGLIPVQIAIFIVWPPPSDVSEFFIVLKNTPLIGLLNLDLLYSLTVLFMGYLYLAFFVALKDTHKSLSLIALTLGLIGVAIYFN